VCGGKTEKEILFNELGFVDVTITNIQLTATEKDMAPLNYEYQDAQNLTYTDSSFDYVIVRDGLHHCQQPHKALLEMWRVAKKGVIVFEARDSIMMKLLAKVRLTDEYEFEAVKPDSEVMGVDGSSVPNYVYRWTEREIEKTIRSYAPQLQHEFYYNYGLLIPEKIYSSKKNKLILPLIRFFFILFRKQRNLFSVLITKDSSKVQPWINKSNG
jgi:ubiquinone/menaquinone biosynthesis C-methylase UbiE